MMIRIRFRKYGIMKFIGHLDIMRYFQKAMRRANIDICYSTGFSPHMIMSFASPLGVGLTSDGEYMDIEIGSELSSASAVSRLNAVMAEGVEVMSFRRIPDGKASNAMALVAAADYEVRFREDCGLPEGWQERFRQFLEQPSISVVKKTKKGERELDIRPLIYEAEVKTVEKNIEKNAEKTDEKSNEKNEKTDEEVIFLKLSAGSADNLKPELVLEAFAATEGYELSEQALLVHRLEMYADIGGAEGRRLVTLESLGEDF